MRFIWVLAVLVGCGGGGGDFELVQPFHVEAFILEDVSADGTVGRAYHERWSMRIDDDGEPYVTLEHFETHFDSTVERIILTAPRPDQFDPLRVTRVDEWGSLPQEVKDSVALRYSYFSHEYYAR